MAVKFIVGAGRGAAIAEGRRCISIEIARYKKFVRENPDIFDVKRRLEHIHEMEKHESFLLSMEVQWREHRRSRR